MSDADNIPADALLKPSPNLDDLVKQFNNATASPVGTQVDPAIPSASERLAEIEHLRAAVEGYKNNYDSELSKMRPIIEESERRQQREEMEIAVEETRRLNDLYDIPAELIETALRSDDPEAAVGALTALDGNYRSHAIKRDIEAAAAAVRNSTTSGPAVSRWDSRRAMNASDEEYERMKAEYLAGGGR